MASTPFSLVANLTGVPAPTEECMAVSNTRVLTAVSMAESFVPFFLTDPGC